MARAVLYPYRLARCRTQNRSAGVAKMDFLVIFAIVGIWFAVRGDAGYIGSRTKG